MELNTSFSLLNILSWIIFGLIVGVIVNFIDPRGVRGGLLGTIVMGIVGALLGGFLTNLLFGVGITGFDLQSIVIATLGGLLLAFIARVAYRSRYFRSR